MRGGNIRPQMRVLGFRAQQVRRFVHDYAAQNEGWSPSYDIICSALGMDKGNLSRTIANLERLGHLSRVGKGRVRRIRLPASSQLCRP
jgi:hypothetical protein